MPRFTLVRAIALASAVAGACTAIHADTAVKAVGIHLGSHHFPARDFNNFNPGAYVRWSNGITAGAYYNSERRTSVYAGYTYDWGPVAVTVGAITGYKNDKEMPMVVPSIRLGVIGQTTFSLAYVPRTGRNSAHAVHLMGEF